MRCNRCGMYVPQWLWVGDDHPMILDEGAVLLIRSENVVDNTMTVRAEKKISVTMCGDVNKPKTDGDFIVIGSECFTDKATLVISYKGENYYKACGKFICEHQNGTRTHCVKRVGHFNDCEDYDGTTRREVRSDLARDGQGRYLT